MSQPIWIREDVARSIHSRQLAEHGGEDGIRDVGMFESAMARPKNLLAYSERAPDLAQMAASYAFGLVKNHPFIDGNKRTGYVVCRTFLLLNGQDLVASAEDKYMTFYRLAAGDISEEELTEWLRKHMKKARQDT